jgi:hypothetical protein
MRQQLGGAGAHVPLRIAFSFVLVRYMPFQNSPHVAPNCRKRQDHLSGHHCWNVEVGVLVHWLWLLWLLGCWVFVIVVIVVNMYESYYNHLLLF